MDPCKGLENFLRLFDQGGRIMPFEIKLGICPHCDHDEFRRLTYFVSEDGDFKQLFCCEEIV